MNTEQLLQQIDHCYQNAETGKAEALLNAALTECGLSKDDSSLLTVYNELMGLYRETGRA